MYHGKNSNSRIKNRSNLLVWGLVLVMMPLLVAGRGIAVGDVEQGLMVADAGENIEAVDVGAGGSEAGPEAEEDVSVSKTIQSITFKKDIRISDALRFLAARYQKNIVPSPSVDGQLVFTSLYDVTFEEAMEAILGGKFEYEQKGNLIEVYPTGDVSRMKHEVFALYYIAAAEASKLILPVLSNSGKIGVTTPAETGVPTGESISSDPAGGDTMAMRDTIVVYDFAENIAAARKVIASVDTRPSQILIEATILSATLTEGMELGVNLNLLAGVSMVGTSTVTQTAGTDTAIETTNDQRTVLEQIAAGVAGSALETTGFATAGGSGLRIGVRSGNVTAFITALEQVTDITILANPKILAVNKQLGQVYIGQKLGYREGDIETLGGGTQEGTVKFLDTGTKLSFRPYIGADGYIRMDIHPKDSTGTLNAEGVPNEDSTELSTNIMVKDGQTIVIGGLFRDKVTTTRKQVPLLGDIPLIGSLFRSNSDSTVRQEVIVLLTCHIIEKPDEVNGQARTDDVSRKRFGAKEGLQWIGRTRLAEDRYANAAKYYLEGDNEAAMKELKGALELRPTYLEAIRLKERIIAEIDPDMKAKIERNMLDTVEQEDTKKWMRR